MLPAGKLDEVELRKGSTVSRLPAGSISVHYTTSCNTQSSAPEDGQNNFPKHVELIGIINKRLLLHLVGCLYRCISDARSNKHQLYTNDLEEDFLALPCSR